MLYGSKAEEKFQQSHQQLMPIHNKLLKGLDRTNIRFSDGVIEFNAMGDFYDVGSKTVVEFKCAKLNQYRTRDEARYAQGQTSIGYLTKYKDWSNSMYKHLIVQERMKEDGFNYITVFSKTAKLSVTQKNKLVKIGLNWCYEQELEDRLNTTYH